MSVANFLLFQEDILFQNFGILQLVGNTFIILQKDRLLKDVFLTEQKLCLVHLSIVQILQVVMITNHKKHVLIL